MEPTRPHRFALVPLACAVLLAGSGRSQAQGGSWVKVADMLTPRRLLAAASEEGNLYTFGGCGSPCFGPPFHTSADEETTVEVYLPRQKEWVEKNRMPTILFGAAAVAPGNGKIYTFGGYVSGNVVQEYDPKKDSWKIRRPMPTPRYGLAAVAVGGKIYVLGGSGPNAALEIYDPAKDTWTPGAPMPTPRVFLAAAAVDGRIYAIGGSPDCCGDSQTAAVEIYDPVKDAWEAGPRLPSARQVSAAVGLNGNIYVFGGFVPGSGVLADTQVYDSRTGRWAFGTPMRVARDQAPAVLIGSQVFVPGGSVDCHCRALARTDLFEEDAPLLECTKDLQGPASVAVGEIVTYAIRVENPGPVAVTGVTLNDPPPEGLTFVPDGKKPCGTGLPCVLGTLAPGESRSVDVRFRVDAAGSCDNEITNVATVSAVEAGPFKCPAEPVSVQGGPAALTCTKAGPSSAKAGDPFHYSVEVINIGCNPVRNVALSDPTPAGLELVGASCGKLPCKLGTLEPEESRMVTLSFRTAQGCSDRASVVNVAKVSGKGVPAETCSMETLLLAEADLGVELGAPDSVAGNATFDLEVKISNAGPATARDATVSLDLQGASVASAPPGCPADLHEPGPFTCVLGDLPCGEKTLTFKIQAPACADCAPQPGPITVNAAVASETSDPDLSNNSASGEVEVDCEVAPSLTLLCDPVAGTFVEGSTVTYTFELANCGPADLMDNPGDELKDVLPPGLTLLTASSSSGTTVKLDNVVTWNGAVAVGKPVTITIEAAIDPGTAGMAICNQAEGSFDLDGDGVDETILSDDPHIPGGPDPCCFTVLDDVTPIPGDLPIPTLSDLATVALALLLAALSLWRLRRPSAGR